MNWKVVSIAAFVGLVACMYGLFFTGSLFGNGPVTIGIQIASAVLMAWARITFGARSFHASANPTAGDLVTNGPYRYFRHPIYAAILYFVWAGIAAHFSTRSALLGLVATAMLALRMLSEETMLRQTYPHYGAYASRTTRVLPYVF